MYIDPNTGGMLFQVLAVLFGLFSGIVLIFSSKIRMFFSRLNRMRHAEPEENTDFEQQEDSETEQ
ncbi:MAG: hypothetical protein A2Z16_13575 [Chloroflexi bacterium RBG_16_54_18]|nr:MAG: hypothetical protein A2Z16_13575 [Chloroflexi bacterium RBG_16_54_18]